MCCCRCAVPPNNNGRTCFSASLQGAGKLQHLYITCASGVITFVCAYTVAFPSHTYLDLFLTFLPCNTYHRYLQLWFAATPNATYCGAGSTQSIKLSKPSVAAMSWTRPAHHIILSPPSLVQRLYEDSVGLRTSHSRLFHITVTVLLFTSSGVPRAQELRLLETDQLSSNCAAPSPDHDHIVIRHA